MTQWHDLDEQLARLEQTEEFGGNIIGHVREALQRRQIISRQQVRQHGYKFFQDIPGIGRKALGVIGRLIGEEWPPPHTVSPALRVSSEVLIRILEGRGYTVIRTLSRENQHERPPRTAA